MTNEEAIRTLTDTLGYLIVRESRILNEAMTSPRGGPDASDDRIADKRKAIADLREIRTRIEDLGPILG